MQEALGGGVDDSGGGDGGRDDGEDEVGVCGPGSCWGWGCLGDGGFGWEWGGGGGGGVIGGADNWDGGVDVVALPDVVVACVFVEVEVEGGGVGEVEAADWDGPVVGLYVGC